MQSFLFTIVSFVLAIGVLITVHEFGHFWVARKLGVKVLRFSVGFGQTLWKHVSKVDQTEYVIAAIPLGGYVKMLDEREEPVDPQEQHRAFNRKSLAARSAIVVAGPLSNFIFAIIAFWLIFTTGDVGLKAVIGEVTEGSQAEMAGFQSGQQIVAVGDKPTQSWESVVYQLLSASLDQSELAIHVVDADGGKLINWINPKLLHELAEDGQLLQQFGLAPVRPVLPPVIDKVIAGEAAATAGLKAGDRLLSADGQQIDNWTDWVNFVRKNPGRLLLLEVERAGELLQVELTPAEIEVDGKRIGRIGASVDVPAGPLSEYQVIVRYGPLEAFSHAIGKTWELSGLMLKMLGKMVLGEVSVKNLSGPISIADSAGKSASYGISHFLKFLAVVSISLGVLNLLPIPVLDGGHLLFFLIEAIRGGPLPERFLEQGQKVGLLILLGIMGLAFYIDLNRFFG